MFHDFSNGNTAQIKTLTTRKNGGQHFLRLGGGEDKLHVRGRFLQRFQQRIKCGGGEHVHLVDDVHFEAATRRRVRRGIAQLAHLLDAVVARAVNFQNVQRAAFGDLNAALVVVLKVHRRAVSGVEAFGKDTGDGCLARASRAAEKICVRDAAGGDGVTQRLRDVLLPNDLSKPLRSILSRYDLIRHFNPWSGNSIGQGDHGRCGASYRCCLPALAEFASPHSMGPDAPIVTLGGLGGKQIQSKLFVGPVTRH